MEPTAPSPADSPATSPPAAPAPGSRPRQLLMPLLLVLLLVLLLAVAVMWQKLEHTQSQLARASTDALTLSMEAKASAKNAQDTARDVSNRLGLAESRLAEVSLQRGQLEELIQSMSRSRDLNLVSDIDSALRLAQQQSQMLGSAEPLLEALKTAEQRIKGVNQTKLQAVARAITHDIDRLKTARILDIGGASLSLDEVSRMIDELPLVHDVATAKPATPKASAAQTTSVDTMLGWGDRIWQDIKGLVRISKVDTVDASLLSPSEGFFVRENLKLRLLNARMGLLSRHLTSTASDLRSAQQNLGRYFDPRSKAVQVARERITQVQAQLQNNELPRLDETLAALAAASR